MKWIWKHLKHLFDHDYKTVGTSPGLFGDEGTLRRCWCGDEHVTSTFGPIKVVIDKDL